jgi:hypothetical protein
MLCGAAWLPACAACGNRQVAKQPNCIAGSGRLSLMMRKLLFRAACTGCLPACQCDVWQQPNCIAGSGRYSMCRRDVLPCLAAGSSIRGPGLALSCVSHITSLSLACSTLCTSQICVISSVRQMITRRSG